MVHWWMNSWWLSTINGFFVGRVSTTKAVYMIRDTQKLPTKDDAIRELIFHDATPLNSGQKFNMSNV